ncbi:MarR family winged helix-turn-helix transcriptional regulator [Agromyces sp. NPDC056379]|uniref:MarR family winged helix-turn-helix transcriptional regulator n=1 Tax=unclassified Agromyces TaxID=2639701 RepID=UPI0035D82C31
MALPVMGYAGHTLPLASHLARAGWRALDLSAQPGDVTHRQLLVLTLIRDRGRMAQKDIRDVFGLDSSNVVGLLNELEERGLTVRRRDPSDRRRHIVELTDAGIKVLEAAYARLAAVEDDLLHSLTTDERQQLHQLLLRVMASRPPGRSSAEARG